jgi:hypothetical protein
MARSGKANFGDLENFKKKVEKSLSDKELDQFIDSCAKELAARFLAKVIKRTPVGQYPKSSGKKGGTLRRGWTNGSTQAGAAYANELKVHHFGNAYVIEIINPIEYASYVEFGHRTRNHKGWVEGKFMMTISAEEVQRDAPKILEAKLKKKLGECFK